MVNNRLMTKDFFMKQTNDYLLHKKGLDRNPAPF